MPKDNRPKRAPAQRSAQRQGALQLWPLLVALVLVGGAIWLLVAHERSANQPTPVPSVLASEHYPSQGHQGHMPGDAKRYANFRYSSDPPTSGFHLERFPPAFVNSGALPKYVQVHMLEHGNILLQYNCLCPDTVNALTEIANEYDSRLVPGGVTSPTTEQVQQALENGLGVVVAPYPSMKHTIALTAWTRLATMETVNKADIVSFINRWMRDSDNLGQ